MKYQNVMLPLGVLVLAGAALYQNRQTSDELRALRKQVSAVQAQETRQTPDEPSCPEAPVVPPANVWPAQRPEPEPTPEKRQDRVAEREPAKRVAPAKPAELAAVNERAFEEQRVDSAWARDSAIQLRGGLEQLVARGALRSLECRETLCKAELKCADGKAVSEFVDAALRSESRVWNGPAAVLKTGETERGEWTVSAFFAREGTTLPTL